jgi:hypothetical protein
LDQDFCWKPIKGSQIDLERKQLETSKHLEDLQKSKYIIKLNVFRYKNTKNERSNFSK